MSRPDDPAFPGQAHISGDGFHKVRHEGSVGLTKREMIAAMTMQGICASTTAWYELRSDKFASTSVTLTDALLAELSKEPSK